MVAIQQVQGQAAIAKQNQLLKLMRVAQQAIYAEAYGLQLQQPPNLLATPQQNAGLVRLGNTVPLAAIYLTMQPV